MWEVLTDHLLIKSQSAVVYSFRKLGHKITISQFDTTVAYSIDLKRDLRNKQQPS